MVRARDLKGRYIKQTPQQHTIGESSEVVQNLVEEGNLDLNLEPALQNNNPLDPTDIPLANYIQELQQKVEADPLVEPNFLEPQGEELVLNMENDNHREEENQAPRTFSYPIVLAAGDNAPMKNISPAHLPNYRGLSSEDPN